MERLRFIERKAYWCGEITRQDLAVVFGLSPAQASADLQKYQELNSGALLYNLNKKRYEGAPRMRLTLQQPRLEEAMAQFLDSSVRDSVGFNGWGGNSPSPNWDDPDATVACVTLPVRRASTEVERRVFLAVKQERRLRVKYLSVNSGTEEWRWLRPRAFAHNGHRWHVRAWCERSNEWRDFTLSRIAAAEWPEPCDPPPPDEEWQRWVTLRLRPHHKLTSEQQRAVAFDHGMTNGVIELRVRAALEGYVRDLLRLPLRTKKPPPPLLEEVE